MFPLRWRPLVVEKGSAGTLSLPVPWAPGETSTGSWRLIGQIWLSRPQPLSTRPPKLRRSPQARAAAPRPGPSRSSLAEGPPPFDLSRTSSPKVLYPQPPSFAETPAPTPSVHEAQLRGWDLEGCSEHPTRVSSHPLLSPRRRWYQDRPGFSDEETEGQRGCE